jgi:hypothetical protein
VTIGWQSLPLDHLQKKGISVQRETRVMIDLLRSIDPTLARPSSLDVDINIHESNRDGTVIHRKTTFK